MGLKDELSKALSPHSKKLADTLNLQGAVLHERLRSIERHVSDMARPDVGDLWRDMEFKGEIGAFAPKEFDAVPMNEIWAVQAVNALFPSAVERLIIRANGKLRVVLAVTTTLPITLGIGGNIVFLPGELITVEGEKAAVGELSLLVVRKRLPVNPIPRQTGRAQGEITAPSNTHDPARDVIRSRTGTYQEVQGEIRDTGGRPSLIDPTSV